MDKFTLAVVFGVLALVAAGLISAAVLRGRALTPDPTTPSGVVLSYAQAIQRGDPQSAWELLSTSAQARADHDRFFAHVGSGNQNANAYLTTEDERIDDTGANVSLVRTYPGSGGIFGSSGYANRTTVRLVREAPGWRISVPPDNYLFFLAKP